MEIISTTNYYKSDYGSLALWGRKFAVNVDGF